MTLGPASKDLTLHQLATLVVQAQLDYDGKTMSGAERVRAMSLRFKEACTATGVIDLFKEIERLTQQLEVKEQLLAVYRTASATPSICPNCGEKDR